MNMYVLFGCGARYSIQKPLLEMNKNWKRERGSNARYSICVFSTRKGVDRPVMQDGTSAPCFMGCPVTAKKSKRKCVCAIPPDNSNGREFHVICYGTEVIEQEQYEKAG